MTKTADQVKKHRFTVKRKKNPTTLIDIDIGMYSIITIHIYILNRGRENLYRNIWAIETYLHMINCVHNEKYTIECEV